MKRTYWILLGLLALFLILYLVASQKEKRRLSAPITENFLGIDTSAVFKIEIKRLGLNIVFERKDDVWWMTQPENYEADQQSINGLLESAQNLKVKNLISSNVRKQIKFQVDTLTGTRLNLFYDENPEASVVIGKISPDFTHCYVRKTDSDEVYLAATYLSLMLNRSPKGWKNREILKLNPQEVSSVEIMKGKNKFKIEREDTLWRASLYPYKKSFDANKESTEKFLNALCYLVTDDFPGIRDLEKLDFENPDYHYRITLRDQSEKSLMVFKLKDQEGRYFLKKNQDDTMFLLYGQSFERIDKEIDDFKSE
ncbi:MAG: hypothetical protein AMJ90_04460 [candidate division Zixibacteria bacterium SM23_73_2]|nr:MAG: hypothetical protein AMJ90_04460 [candidate division Zixibacteria bacterium SM23_73_2]